jgi:large subunit ribosomal protein L9
VAHRPRRGHENRKFSVNENDGETVMEVILLERVGKLGQMGDVVRVKDGFARNFLLPKGKALRANDENKAKFEAMKSQLQARNLELKGDAQAIASRLDGHNLIVLRQASESGQLFGSVSTRDLAVLLSESGFAVNRSQVALNAPIKAIGLHKVPIALHPEIEVTITVNVARSADEAERIARGENIAAPRAEAEESAAAVASAEAFFENPEDAEQRVSAEESGESSPAKEPTPEKS